MEAPRQPRRARALGEGAPGVEAARRHPVQPLLADAVAPEAEAVAVRLCLVERLGHAPPEQGVSLAEVALHTALDSAEGDPLRNLARAAGEPDGEAAARILADLGPDGLAALSDALPAMTTVGARRAVRFLAAVADPRVVGALVQALGRADVEEAAARALQRDGAAALAPLAAALRDNPRAAPVLASLVLIAASRSRHHRVGGLEARAWTVARRIGRPGVVVTPAPPRPAVRRPGASTVPPTRQPRPDLALSPQPDLAGAMA